MRTAWKYTARDALIGIFLGLMLGIGAAYWITGGTFP